MPTSDASTSPQASFRRLLPPPAWPKLTTLSSSSAQQWYDDKKTVPALVDFLARLEAKNLERPFVGITSDGHVIPGLFEYSIDEGAPVAAMCEAADALLSMLSVQQEHDTVFTSVFDDNVRLWSNPEFYINPGKLLSFDGCI
jgi:hypothetical protein